MTVATPRERIVFLGSGPVAARSLELLAESFVIEAVITKSTTEQMLRDVTPEGAPVLIANTKKELDLITQQSQFTSKIAIVIDYGVIISRESIERFPLGIINSHFSLLPEWRGADPITFSLLSGQTETGVSVMLINQALDEGDLLAQASYALSPSTTTPQLTQDLIELSNALLVEIVPSYLAGNVVPADQIAASIAPSKQPSYSRKLTKADGTLDFTKPAEILEREVRAFLEWPKSRTRIANRDVVITSTKVVDLQIGEAGTCVQHEKRLFVQATPGALEILALKPAGKKEMTAAAFLAGYGHSIDRL